MKKFSIIATLLLSVAVLGGCGNPMNTANNKSDSNTNNVVADGGNNSSMPPMDIEIFNGNISAEELKEAEEKDIQFECKTDNDVTIRGSIRLPENYDENVKYPVAVLSHGILGDRNQGGFFTGLASPLERNGIISVRFDFDGYGGSDGELINNSLKTECEDLKAVIKYVQTLDYVDTDKINLVGFSMGGAVTSLVAGELKDEIHSVALWAPASVLVDDSAAGRLFDATVDVNDLPDEVPVMGGHFVFGKAFFEDSIGVDIYGIAQNYTGPVMILQGNADQIVPMEYAEKYNEVYADSELVVIDKGEHAFSGEPLEKVISLTTDFLKAENN